MLTPGTVVASRYAVERFLAAGGMGAVYVARDTSMDALVALKLSFAPKEQADMRARFAREARIANRLGRLPGVVRALDYGEVRETGALFLVLDLIRNARPLDLAAGTLGDNVARLVEAARIVARVNAAGVVHRDLKPENFLSEPDGTLWLSDFGIAKLDGESDLLASEPTGGFTASGVGFGTPFYMSPEQLEDAKRVDARTDVYALGVMLFLAATGHHPYRAASIGGLIAQHTRVREGRAPAPRLRDHDGYISSTLDDIAVRATALDRSLRTPSVSELVRELEEYLERESPTRTNVPLPPRPSTDAPTLPPTPPSEPAPPAAPSAPRGSAVAALTFRLGVVPILAGRDWIDEGTFAAVEEWERWLMAKRHPGAALSVERLPARKGDRGPLKLPLHEPFTRSILEELSAKNQLWRAWTVHLGGAWALLVRLVPYEVRSDLESWQTVPEAEGGIWSAPVAHDGAELREALGRFRASDWLATEPLAAYREALEALGRFGRTGEVIGRAIPEAYCAGCSLGSFHGLLAPLARGEVAPGSRAEIVFRGPTGEARLASTDLVGPWRCPRCGGASVRLRFAHSWDDSARVAPAPTAREVHAGASRVLNTGDPIATAARLVVEKRGPGNLIVVVSTRRPELDSVVARLRALGLPEERIVRRSPSGIDRPAALASGSADCLLVEVGADGPGTFSLDAFPGEVQIVVTSPATLPTNALDAIEHAIAARRGGR